MKLIGDTTAEERLDVEMIVRDATKEQRTTTTRDWQVGGAIGLSLGVCYDMTPLR